MLRKFRPGVPGHTTVVAYLALFAALGGTSYAAVTLKRGSVKSSHIKNGQVKRPDIARGAVDSRRVRDRSLSARDFAPGTLKPGPAGPPGAQGAPGAQGLAGADGQDGILDAIGRTGQGGRCVPSENEYYERPNPNDCAVISLTLTRESRVLLLADTDWSIYGGRRDGSGVCRFKIDEATPADSPKTEPGSKDIDEVIHGNGHAGLNWVTGPLAPGTHRFALHCDDVADSLLAFPNPTISAVAISPK